MVLTSAKLYECLPVVPISTWSRIKLAAEDKCVTTLEVELAEAEAKELIDIHADELLELCWCSFDLM